MVVDSRRLAKIYATSISPGIKSLHAGHWQHRGSARNPKMGSIAKGRGLGPQIGSVGLKIGHFSRVIAVENEKMFWNVFERSSMKLVLCIRYTCWSKRALLSMKNWIRVIIIHEWELAPNCTQAGCTFDMSADI